MIEKKIKIQNKVYERKLRKPNVEPLSEPGDQFYFVQCTEPYRKKPVLYRIKPVSSATASSVLMPEPLSAIAANDLFRLHQ